LNLGMVAIDRQARRIARGLLGEALDIARDTGSTQAGQSVLEVAAALAGDVGDATHAGAFFGAAEARAVESGLLRDPTDEAFLAPHIASVRRAAPDEFAAGEKAGRSLGYANALLRLDAWLTDPRWRDAGRVTGA
jgi:hypothetical protein